MCRQYNVTFLILHLLALFSMIVIKMHTIESRLVLGPAEHVPFAGLFVVRKLYGLEQ